MSKKVLIIGWDAADWRVINPLLDAGKMPNLQGLIESGVMGNVSSLTPELSPMLWTTIATGKYPFKHGVCGFVEPAPGGEGVQPISGRARTTKALWNILSQENMKSIVIGWWPSHPAEPIKGVMVSNHYQKAVAPIEEDWPLRPGTVHPVRLEKNLAELRVHPQSLEEGHIQPFVPNAVKVDQETDMRMSSAGKIIAECLSIKNAACAVMHHEPWDVAAVYFDGIDHFSHGFMTYHPPRQQWVEEEDFEIYKDVVSSGYIFHDIMLGELLAETNEDTTVILLSDHGFKSDDRRDKNVPLEPAGPAVQHRTHGVLVMKGPGIKVDERIDGASLLDICPTALMALGLPIGKDMDGVPLMSAFDKARDVEYIDSWDKVPGEAGLLPPDEAGSAVDAQAALDQLIELGYIEAPDKDGHKAAQDAVDELQFNKASSFISAGYHKKAIVILRDLHERKPEAYRYGLRLIDCYYALGWHGDARLTIENLIKAKIDVTNESRQKLTEFTSEQKDKPQEEWSEEERRKLRTLSTKAKINQFAIESLLGRQGFEEKEYAFAKEHIEAARKLNAGVPSVYEMLGKISAGLGDWAEAEAHYREAIRLDEDTSSAYIGLSRCYLKQKRNELAASMALKAVGLNYRSPRAHFLLGEALRRIGRFDRAVEALHVAVALAPGYRIAHKHLGSIYARRLNDPQTAELHRERARILLMKQEEAAEAGDNKTQVDDSLAQPESRDCEHDSDVPVENCAVVVSGLPRSGTSMMMQMLHAGGLPVLTDSLREADESNTKGYFEYEPVKALQKTSDWFGDAVGKSVKVIAQLLTFLPEEVPARVIFMDRSSPDVVSSQRAMLERGGKKGANISDERLSRIFSLQKIRAMEIMLRRHIPVLVVSYEEAVADPQQTATKVNRFLDGTLDEARMAEAIDPVLRREKSRDT